MTVLRIVKALERKQEEMKINGPLKEIRRRSFIKTKAEITNEKNLKQSN